MKKELEEYFNNEDTVDKESLISKAQKFDDLLDKAKFLVALGSPVKASKDFERAIRKSISELHKAIINIELDEDFSFTMTDQEKDQAKQLAKKNGIRPFWLLGELE